MGRVALFIGAVALAVALGIAAAPYVLWLVPLAILVAPVVWLVRRLGWRGVGTLSAGLVVVGLFVWWAVFLARRGQWADAGFVLVLAAIPVWRGARTRLRERVTASVPR